MEKNQEDIFHMEAVEAGAVSSAQMKEIERKADEAGLSYYQMMENAGTGAADYISENHPVSGKTVSIFCGKGNNGGDGFVVARKFAEKEALVKLILVEGEPKTEDADKNKQLCEVMAIPMMDLIVQEREISPSIEDADLIIDAIYGTGFHGELRDSVRKVTRMINQSKAVVYALDIPSGLNGDTGEADEDTVRADGTIVFHRLKPAHIKEKCSRYYGRTVCISIGIEAVLD
ncbi:MAG TPA: NAD(P)H-hydrate epimerase [Anaerovoracaceae bacterium]|nr:NAD(P)H-hydrate epimerase [Anaerovoracaceae bacterium]